MSFLAKIKTIYVTFDGVLSVQWERPNGVLVSNALNDWAIGLIIESFVESGNRMMWEKDKLSEDEWMPSLFLVSALASSDKNWNLETCRRGKWCEQYRAVFCSVPNAIDIHRICFDATMGALAHNGVDKRHVENWFALHSEAAGEAMDLPQELDYMRNWISNYKTSRYEKRMQTLLAHRILYFLGSPQESDLGVVL